MMKLLKLNEKSIADFCAYVALSQQKRCNKRIINCDNKVLYNTIADSVSSPIVAALILDELKTKCSSAQKLSLLQKILETDDLLYIIENFSFDKYIIKKIIASNPSEDVMLAIVKKYIKTKKDILNYSTKNTKELIDSLFILNKLEK